MMKISDPIMFGHIVKSYYAPLFETHGAAMEKVWWLGLGLGLGLGSGLGLGLGLGLGSGRPTAPRWRRCSDRNIGMEVIKWW